MHQSLPLFPGIKHCFIPPYNFSLSNITRIIRRIITIDNRRVTEHIRSPEVNRGKAPELQIYCLSHVVH